MITPWYNNHGSPSPFFIQLKEIKIEESNHKQLNKAILEIFLLEGSNNNIVEIRT